MAPPHPCSGCHRCCHPESTALSTVATEHRRFAKTGVVFRGRPCAGASVTTEGSIHASWWVCQHLTSRPSTLKDTHVIQLAHSSQAVHSSRAVYAAVSHCARVHTASWAACATTSVRLHRSRCSKMGSCSFVIDDGLAEASPVLGRMRLDGLAETAVPFAERVVLLWRRGAPTSDMSVETFTSVLKVRCISFSYTTSCTCAAGNAL